MVGFFILDSNISNAFQRLTFTSKVGDAKMAWRSAAEAKFESINNSIPQNWRIGKVSSPEQQRDVTSTVHEHLSQDELEITGSDAVEIVQKTSSGKWKAVDVTRAFCHRASIAHQLVKLRIRVVSYQLDSRPLDKLLARDVLRCRH